MNSFTKNLVNNLVPVFSVVLLYSFNLFGLQSEKFGFHNLKNGSLGLHRANSGIDLMYIKGNIQYRQFTNKDNIYSFFVKDFGSKTIVLGQEQDKDSSKKSWILFSYKNVPRYNSSEPKYIPFCSAKTSFSTYQNASNKLAELLDGLENEKIANTFDKKTCDTKLVTNDVASLVKKSIVATTDTFQKCLFGVKSVKEKLMENDDFSRLMFTYLVNLQSFTDNFFSKSKVLDFTCSDLEVAELRRAPQQDGEAPAFSIHLPKQLLKDIAENDDDDARTKFEDQFSKVITHEIKHVFFSIPLVKNANKCEHEYQDLISKNCTGLIDNIAIIRVEPKTGVDSKIGAIPECVEISQHAPSINSIPDRAEVMASDIARARDAASISREGGSTPAEGNGVPRKGSNEISSQMGQVTVASARNSDDSPLVKASTDAGGEIRRRLTGREESQVRAVGTSVFSTGRSDNTDVQQIANRIFVETNAARQKQAIEQVADRLDPQMEAFRKGAAVLYEAFGANEAVAAAVPASTGTLNRTVANSLGGNGAPDVTATISPQQALKAFINGNPGPSQASAPAKLAGKLSNAGGISKITSGSTGPARTSPVIQGGQSIEAASAATEKVNSPPSSSEVQMQSSSNQQNSYQLQGPTSTVQDTAKLRMLSSARTITGNSYVAIKNDYKSKTFVKALAERKILIRVVDPATRKIKITYGTADSIGTPSRQPSSTGSGLKTKKQSHPDIVFEDNGTSLRKLDN